MDNINHNFYAKKTIGFLINHVITFKKGNKFITYGDLAKAINYPKPHTGNFFGSNIGKTLGVMGVGVIYSSVMQPAYHNDDEDLPEQDVRLSFLHF